LRGHWGNFPVTTEHAPEHLKKGRGGGWGCASFITRYDATKPTYYSGTGN